MISFDALTMISCSTNGNKHWAVLGLASLCSGQITLCILQILKALIGMYMKAFSRE